MKVTISVAIMETPTR